MGALRSFARRYSIDRRLRKLQRIRAALLEDVARAARDAFRAGTELDVAPMMHRIHRIEFVIDALLDRRRGAPRRPPLDHADGGRRGD